MATDNTETPSIEAMKSKLKAIRSVHLTIIGIFCVIILGWLVTGVWQKNLPMFITTVVLAVSMSVTNLAVQSKLKAEISKREGNG
ncbi:hypothetical protein [Tautonia rosea]|uniref:hypothetical protein n=1 Tax=Tautonia rosea TaxID=2728037 RepID=UPI001472ACFE|nr:hypothetical protein [Tautonia rosea]